MNNLNSPEADNSRRAFLRTTLLGTVATTLPTQVLARAATPPKPSGLIVREREPENLEFPFSELSGFITPNERFFVENHFGMPRLEARSFRLQVEGAVERPFEITFDELAKMPQRTITATVESAGNGRVFLPRAEGVQWEMGAVGNAEWTGVPLSAILERAGVRPEAVEVVLEGADSGEVRDAQRPTGSIRYARSLPIAKARQADVLLALKMNGADLPQAQGFPLRAVVPGWYGASWVRWLSRILVASTPFRGYFQAVDNSVWERRNGVAQLAPVAEMQVKAQIARPAMYERVPANAPYRIFGAAWTGDSEIAQVEVSVDEGRNWERATLLGQPVRHAWRLWEHRWTPTRAGRAVLMARATDAGGRVQPMQRDNDRRGFMISHVLAVPVEVLEPPK